MKSYSEDLRKKIVAVAERGMSNSETARLFGVSLSSVKRYVSGWPAEREVPRPEEEARQGSPKVHQSAKRLLNEDMKERPAATTIAERTRFLQSVTGKRLGYSTIRRALKRLGGWSRKKDRWGLGARGVAESRWRVMVAAQLDPERLMFSWTRWEPIPRLEEAFSKIKGFPCEKNRGQYPRGPGRGDGSSALGG
jgi:transposase